MKKMNYYKQSLLFLIGLIGFIAFIQAQGWAPVNTKMAGTTSGPALLLSDGSIMVGIKDTAWDRLKPSSTGSYANGTWTHLAKMHETRAAYSSQTLKDGRIYVAGAEYGTGGSTAEIYDPLTNTWNYTSASGFQGSMVDACAEIFNDGRVLQAAVNDNGRRGTKLYNPATNTWSATMLTLGSHNETTWVKLTDGSILQVDLGTRNSERYIPSLGTWIADATLPVDLYDQAGECGGGYLLPNGKVFMTGGATGKTAIYTPSGNNFPGSWVAGPNLPNNTGAMDGGGCMMPTGNIVLALSPIGPDEYAGPTYFYEYNYRTNAYTQVPAPGGGMSVPYGCYHGYFLQMPYGKVLYAEYQISNQCYIYSPIGEGNVEPSGIPAITGITNQSCRNYTLTGTGLGGISEGACYGDDEQATSNYPIIKLTSGANVYYARTFNWSSRGVRQGAATSTTQFTVSNTVPAGTYSLSVSVNGISSNVQNFTVPSCLAAAKVNGNISTAISQNVKVNSVIENTMKITPNPVNRNASVFFTSKTNQPAEIEIVDANSRVLFHRSQNLVQGINTIRLDVSNLTSGVYYAIIHTGQSVITNKLVIQK
jgi:hypothetical protein